MRIIGYFWGMAIAADHIERSVSDHLKKHFLAKNVAIEPHVPFADSGIDSMTVVELVMFIEEEFGIVIPADQLTGDNLRSLRSLADCAFRQQR